MNEPVTGSHSGRAEQPRPTRVNNRQIVAVYIRGLAFKCGSGSRREQVLKHLQQIDDSEQISIWLVAAITIAALVVGFGFGYYGWKI